MNIILLLIPISLVLLGLAVAAFFWAVDHAQFDDMDTPALAPLIDDSAPVARDEAAADQSPPA